MYVCMCHVSVSSHSPETGVMVRCVCVCVIVWWTSPYVPMCVYFPNVTHTSQFVLVKKRKKKVGESSALHPAAQSGPTSWLPTRNLCQVFCLCVTYLLLLSGEHLCVSDTDVIGVFHFLFFAGIPSKPLLPPPARWDRLSIAWQRAMSRAHPEPRC